MDSSFYALLGQVGATVVSIAFTLFVGYLLYLKQQRDRFWRRIFGLWRAMSSIVHQLSETPIPGVVQSLLSRPKKGQEWDKLSITNWAAGTSWEMRVGTGRMTVKSVWNGVREVLEDLVRGVLPNGYLPRIKTDRSGLERFRKWGRNYLRKTEHIEWLHHEFAGYNWMDHFLEKMKAWENRHFNPVLISQDVVLLGERVMKLRRLVSECLRLERDYQHAKIENAVNRYKTIIAGFMTMGFFSIVIPLIMLLLPPFRGEYLVAPISFMFFMSSTLFTFYLLLKSATR